MCLLNHIVESGTPADFLKDISAYRKVCKSLGKTKTCSLTIIKKVETQMFFKSYISLIHVMPHIFQHAKQTKVI